MRVVIQCASTKDPDAGSLWTRRGERVVFVARPELAPAMTGTWWARPDDPSDVGGFSWRDRVEAVNADRSASSGLLPAFELYRPPAFGRLVARFGLGNVFILSAGWGLVRADFRLPDYDITFSKQAERYKRRNTGDAYRDFVQLPPAASGQVVFLGGRDYLPLLFRLTRNLQAPVIVPFRCDPADEVTGVLQDGHVRRVPYRTNAKTNWHYGCAERLCQEPTFLDGGR